jgi:hypothetical protein
MLDVEADGARDQRHRVRRAVGGSCEDGPDLHRGRLTERDLGRIRQREEGVRRNLRHGELVVLYYIRTEDARKWRVLGRRVPDRSANGAEAGVLRSTGRHVGDQGDDKDQDDRSRSDHRPTCSLDDRG